MKKQILTFSVNSEGLFCAEIGHAQSCFSSLSEILQFIERKTNKEAISTIMIHHSITTFSRTRQLYLMGHMIALLWGVPLWLKTGRRLENIDPLSVHIPTYSGKPNITKPKVLRK